jgi:arylsulfatase A-like enzyme
MPISPPVRRVILVVLDGLRPDALDAFALDHLRRLTALGAFTPHAQTVAPPVTAAAMASLLTGVPPQHHGLTSDHFHLPRPRGPIEPLPALVAGAGRPVTAFVRELPRPFRPLGRVIAARLGVRAPSFAGGGALDILQAARTAVRAQREGLIVLHWPDADTAGHAHGWMSPAYGAACRVLDTAFADLVGESGALHDPDTTVIALADHGGGGVRADDHVEDHPVNRTIPLWVLGGAIAPAALTGSVTLLDVAPTVAWLLGLPRPATWPGRPLREVLAPAVAA